MSTLLVHTRPIRRRWTFESATGYDPTLKLRMSGIRAQLRYAPISTTVWQVGFTDQFEWWWDQPSMEEQAAIDVTVEVLRSMTSHSGKP
jgi:hypothetical protein